MKRILLTVMLTVLAACITYAQNYNPVLNYNLNGTPINGVKIKTNLPFSNSSQMPTIIIEGYSYGSTKPIGISLVWYIWEGSFVSYSATSYGAYAPEIKLSNEGGKVIIYITDQQYYQRFTVRAFAQGMAETANWFQGWSAADEPLTGTNTVTVSYYGPVTTANGNVGIGTTSPITMLDVQGTATIGNPLGGNYNENLRLPVSQNDFASIAIGADKTGSGTIYGQWTLVRNPATSSYRFSIRHLNDELFTIMPSGNVGIGTTSPSEKVAVNGNIRSKKIIVTQTGWPDYVFDSAYILTPLTQIEQFIKDNKHLPDVPSAKEVGDKGLDVGDNQAVLLKKIEELTLYMIEMKKEAERVKKINEERFQKLESENLQLKKESQKIK
ncbi:hypothetical protein ACI6Q2_23175 [Chitinophagaceae bacterium LWZ2-11]